MKFFYKSLCFVLLFTLFGVSVANARFSLSNNDLDVNKITLELDPGETFEGSVLPINIDEGYNDFVLIPVDSYVDNTGSFYLNSPDNEQSIVGTWVDIPNPVVALESGESAQIDYSVTVPEDTPPGQYAGGLLLGINASNDELKESGSSGFSVISYIGVRMFITVSGDLIDQFSWDSYGVGSVTEDGLQQIDYQFSNDGTTLIQVDADVTIDRLFGEDIVLEESLGRIAAGGSINSTVQFERPFFDFLKIISNVKYARIDLSVQGDDLDYIDEITDEVSFFVIPWVVVISIIVIILVLIFFYLRSKKKQMDFISTCELYVVKEGDTLVGLAQKRNVDWKLLAKINKIKSPYFVASKTKIHLPKKLK